MDKLLLVPPLAFTLVLFLSALQSFGFRILAQRPKEGEPVPAGKWKPYACGEDVSEHRIQPDYAQFFPFAFFFTVIHVVALVVATVPTGSPAASGLAAAFLVAATVAVYVLFRR